MCRMAKKRKKADSAKLKESVGVAIRLAANYAGGPLKLGRLAGVGPQVVANWIARKSVPPEFCLLIQHAVDHKILAMQLCPRVFDPAVALNNSPN